MKRYILHIVTIICLIPSGITAQVVDTSKHVNAWSLVHNYSRFEDTKLDTSDFSLHSNYTPLNRYGGWAWDRLGIIGNAAQNVSFFDRSSNSDFMFSSGLQPYLASPDNTIFFNTRSPFTEIVYSSLIGSAANEESVKFLHTQNIDPYTNIGVDFEVLSGKELYQNEATKTTKFTLFGSSAKEKYSAFGSLHFNRFNNFENGGIYDVDSFLGQSYNTDGYTYEVNTEDGKSSLTNYRLFYTQKLAITEKISTTDTLGVTTTTGKNFSFNHQLNIERNNRYFTDDTAGNNMAYQQVYYLDGIIRDSVVQDKINNTFQFILGDPYTDKLSARAYIGHELGRNMQVVPYNTDYLKGSTFDVSIKNDTLVTDTVIEAEYVKYYNDLFAGFYIAGPPESKWYWSINGKYYFFGYHQNNFELDATFARTIKDYRLGLQGSLTNKSPDYFMMNNWSSTQIWKVDDPKSSQVTKGEAFIHSEEKRFDAKFSVSMLTNYWFMDSLAQASITTTPILVMAGEMSKHFTLGGFNSYNRILIQYTSDNSTIRLPLIAVKTSNYWEQSLAKGALLAQFGFDFYMSSKYTSYGYMPTVGKFYLKEDAQTVGAYPFLDVFLTLRIKRTRIFGAYTNSLAGLVSNNYFTVADYPIKPAFLRFGVAWTFYD